MKVVVIGGTGLIGAALVARLRGHGHEAVAASPASGVNAFTGEGLTQSMRGASVVVDVSNARTSEPAGILEFFTTSTRNLLAAEAATGVRHHVALSIVGTERHHDSPYYRAKSAQERLIQSGPIPYTIVHATQFFEFLPRIADRGTTGNVVRVSSALVQPIAAADVASTMERIALGPPTNTAVELAGPEALPLDDAVRRTLAAARDPRDVIGDPETPYAGAPLQERTLLPGPRAELAATRLDDWLAQTATGHRERA
jgi:uncharacterized protein YbjT (DUF2867 family)